MAGRRELLLARLHEQGALTLDLNPEAAHVVSPEQLPDGEGAGDGIAAGLPPSQFSFRSWNLFSRLPHLK